MTPADHDARRLVCRWLAQTLRGFDPRSYEHRDEAFRAVLRRQVAEVRQEMERRGKGLREVG